MYQWLAAIRTRIFLTGIVGKAGMSIVMSNRTSMAFSVSKNFPQVNPELICAVTITSRPACSPGLMTAPKQPRQTLAKGRHGSATRK